MRFFASQLNALADVAYEDDDRPNISCLHFDAEGVVYATNGHRMVIVDLDKTPARSFAIRRRDIKLWCAHAHRTTIVNVVAPKASKEALRAGDVTLLFSEPGQLAGHMAHISFRELMVDRPPPWRNVVPEPLRQRGGWTETPKIEHHGLHARYLDGIGEIGRQFVPAGYGLSLLHSGKCDPLVYGFRGADGRRVLILTMPMLVDRPSHATLVEPAP